MSTESSSTPEATTETVFLWFDTEFTSLHLESAGFMQVAMMATDAGLNRLAPTGEDINLIIRLAPEIEVSDWVQEHIPEIVAASRSDKALPVEDADRRIATYIDEICGAEIEDVADRPILAGNSIHNDFVIGRRLLPETMARCHYRQLDVSVMKIFWQDFLGREAFDKKDMDLMRKYFPAFDSEGLGRAHDAWFDIQASMAEFGFYRSQLV